MMSGVGFELRTTFLGELGPQGFAMSDQLVERLQGGVLKVHFGYRAAIEKGGQW